MSTAAEAAFAAAQEMLDGGVEAPDSAEDPVSSETEAAAEEPQEAETEFSLDPEVPDEIRALVEEPDFEAEAEEELEAVAEEAWDDDEEYVDPRLAEERKKRLAAEKKAAHYEQLRVKDARKAWEAEAAKFFPLANAKKIDATSRRAFLRAAKAQHEENKPFVLAAVAAERAVLDAERAQIREEEKAKLEAAWGKPISGTSQIPSEGSPERQKNLDRVFRERGFHAGVKEMIDLGE